MYSDILVQQLGVKHAIDRLVREAEKRDMVRRAQTGQLARPARIRAAVGAMLIATGHWLQASPATTRDAIGTTRNLSQMKT